MSILHTITAKRSRTLSVAGAMHDNLSQSVNLPVLNLLLLSLTRLS